MAVDTSALVAVVLDENQGAACMAALEADQELVISAVTLAEVFVVAEVRNVSAEMHRLVDGLALQVITVSAATARRVGEVYKRWGKGRHPAGLNFADCFAYDTAQTYRCPLLYIGNDFRRTDIVSVL